MMTEWDEAARNLTARGARGMSERTLSSLQATRVELGLEPVQMPSEDLELADGWEVVVNEPATDEWAEHDAAEHDAVDAEVRAEQEAELEAERAGESGAYVTTDDGDTTTPAWMAGQTTEEAQPVAYEVDLGGGQTYVTHDDDWGRLWGGRPIPQPTAEQEESSTRHTTVEVSKEESDALWQKVYDSQPEALRFTARGEALQEYSDREIQEGSDTYEVATDEEVNDWANEPEETTAGPIMTAAEVAEDMRQRIAQAGGSTWEDGNRGNGWTWHAQGGWRHEAPKAQERTAEEVAAQERQLARTRELREDDDYACDY